MGELIEFQMRKSFNCKIPNYFLAPKIDASLIGFKYKVEVEIKDPTLKSVFTTEEEKYQLKVNKEQSSIVTPTYVGFVRGL